MGNKFFAESLFVSYIKGIPSNTFPIEELRSLLEKARDTDVDLKQFGAEHHKYQWKQGFRFRTATVTFCCRREMAEPGLFTACFHWNR